MHDECLSWLHKLGFEETFKKLTGDASSRQYWRLNNNKGIICHDPHLETLANFIEIRNFLAKESILVPHIYEVSKEKKCMLLEDLGDETFLLEVSKGSIDQEFFWYQKAIDALLALQNITIERIPECVKKRVFDLDKFEYEIKMSLDYFAEKMLRITGEKKDLILKDFQVFISEIIKEKMTFSHRDYHSRNLMVHKDQLYMIDFQDARMGVPQYDLVSLLEDCYFDISFENKSKLLKYYWDRCNRDLFLYNDFEKFMEVYHLTALQRVFKAIGSFSYIYHERNDTRYLKYIGFAMEKIRKTLQVIKIDNHLITNLLQPYYES